MGLFIREHPETRRLILSRKENSASYRLNRGIFLINLHCTQYKSVDNQTQREVTRNVRLACAEAHADHKVLKCIFFKAGRGQASLPVQ